MPVLKDTRKTKEVALPSYPDSKVVIFPSLLVGDLTSIDLVDESFANGVKTLGHLIKSWNFTDESGKDLPISEDYLKKLSPFDLNFLLQEVKAFAEAEKKSLGV